MCCIHAKILCKTILVLALALAVNLVECSSSQLIAEEMSDAIATLKAATVDSKSQATLQLAWKRVAGGGGETLIGALSAMKDAGPNAENWLRAAVETIAENLQQHSGELPTAELEIFLKDSQQSPRARYLAYELLSSVDPTIPDRLLPKFLEDPSFELRFDAVAKALAEAANQPTDAEKIAAYNRVLQSARDKDQLSKCVAALEELGETPNLPLLFGYLTSWKLIGPFDNQENVGLDNMLPAEGEVDYAASYQGKEGEVSWIDFVSTETKLDNLGLVNLNKSLKEMKEVAALAAASFNSAKPQQVEIRYTTKNATKLYVNGELVATNSVYHSGSSFDQYVVPVSFKQGPNQILLKVCQNAQRQPWARAWEFQLRVTDKLGGAVLSEGEE